MPNTLIGPSQLSTRKLRHPREYEEEAMYRAYLFGPFRLFCGDRMVGAGAPRRNKARMLLQWFLLNPGKPLSVDEFLDLFWRDSRPDKAIGNFHVTMHCLRRMLEPDLDPRRESAFIRRGPGNFYLFDTGKNWWTDTGDVEMLLQRGSTCDAQGDKRRARFYYHRIASYCIQGFLADDHSAEWLTPYRARYQHIYTQALLRLMQFYLQSDEPEELLEYAYQMLQVDCYNERAAKVIVVAYLKAGNFERAKRTLDRFCHCLEHDLGVRPTKEFCALRERIHSALKP